MLRAAACASIVLGAILAGALAGVQFTSMAAYGDLAARPSLPALAFDVAAARFGSAAGDAVWRAAALVHDRNAAAATTLVATLPNDDAANDVRGRLAQIEGRDEDALDWYERAGDGARAQALLAVANFSPARRLAAQRALVAMLEARGVAGDPLADAYWTLGELERARSDGAPGGGASLAALAAFGHALAAAPNRKSYLLAAGIEALKLQRPSEAVRWLGRASEVAPGDPGTWGALALAAAAGGDCARARAARSAWAERAAPNQRVPEDDPQFGEALRACLAHASARPAHLALTVIAVDVP